MRGNKTGCSRPRRRRTPWSHFLRFVHYWRSYGPKAAFGGAKAVLLAPIYGYMDRSFDERYGLDTVTMVPLSELTIMAEHFDHNHDVRHYSGTPLAAFRAAMSALPRDLRDYVFIDFGSGKGRVLLLASSYRLRLLVGIEFSKELYDVAVDNVAKYSSKIGATPPICLVNGDVTSYAIPHEQCIFYFYNPFGEDVMSVVLAKVAKSYYENPRKLYFIYLVPRVSQVFDRLEFLRVMKKGKFGALSGIIYETIS